MAFNINALAVKETAILHLLDPESGEPLFDGDKPLTIELCGRASKESRAAMSALNRKFKLREKTKKESTFEEDILDNAKYLAQLSVKANNFDMGDGAIDTHEKFVELYMNDKLYFIKDQVSRFVGSEEAFLSK